MEKGSKTCSHQNAVPCLCLKSRIENSRFTINLPKKTCCRSTLKPRHSGNFLCLFALSGIPDTPTSIELSHADLHANLRTAGYHVARSPSNEPISRDRRSFFKSHSTESRLLTLSRQKRAFPQIPPSRNVGEDQGDFQTKAATIARRRLMIYGALTTTRPASHQPPFKVVRPAALAFAHRALAIAAIRLRAAALILRRGFLPAGAAAAAEDAAAGGRPGPRRTLPPRISVIWASNASIFSRSAITCFNC